jgi:cell division protein FtsZ
MNTAQPLPNQNWICYCHLIDGQVDADYPVLAAEIDQEQVKHLSATQGNALLALAKQHIANENSFIFIADDMLDDAMKINGPAWISVVRASGEDRANKAVAMASRHHVLPKIQHAQSVISSTTATEEMELTEYEDIADQVKEKLTSNKADSQVCFGLAFDDDMGDDICYSMIATGIEFAPSAAA